MTLTPLVVVSFLALCVSAQRFSDFDYQDSQDNSQQLQYQPQSAARPAARSNVKSTSTPPPPVAILKQINTHNDDGSYTYGYEADDGSFKIETKKVTGEVMGKYGYIDTDGKLHTVEYGANKYGFQPSGTGITVPPPTLVDETLLRGPNGEVIEEEEEPQQFRPRPNPASRPAPRQQVLPRPRPQAPSQPLFAPQQQNFAPQPRLAPRPQPQYVQQEPQRAEQPQYEEQQYVAPVVRSRPAAGPVPPRAVIPGAAIAAPQHVPTAPPSAPVYEPQPQVFQAPRRSSPSRPRSSSSMLDDLAQQYALPSNPAARPVADFAFRSDDSAYSRSINF